MAEVSAPPRERGLEPGPSGLKRADVAYIINSAENAVAMVSVEDVFPEDDVIEVWHLAKQERMSFSISTGEPIAPGVEFKHGSPHLAPADDWRVGILLMRTQFNALNEAVRTRLSEYMDDPTGPNALMLSRATDDLIFWTQRQDPRALLSGSIQEYLFADEPGKARREDRAARREARR